MVESNWVGEALKLSWTALSRINFNMKALPPTKWCLPKRWGNNQLGCVAAMAPPSTSGMWQVWHCTFSALNAELTHSR